VSIEEKLFLIARGNKDIDIDPVKLREERVAEIRALQASRQGEDVFEKPITAELINWQKQFLSNGEDYVIWGNIQNQSGFPRFREGEWIRTSLIAKIEGDIAMTLNSVYRLVGEEAVTA
jgi:hypothetical protein